MRSMHCSKRRVIRSRRRRVRTVLALRNGISIKDFIAFVALLNYDALRGSTVSP